MVDVFFSASVATMLTMLAIPCAWSGAIARKGLPLGTSWRYEIPIANARSAAIISRSATQQLRIYRFLWRAQESVSGRRPSFALIYRKGIFRAAPKRL